jgi:SAM-dependent methyltransferase
VAGELARRQARPRWRRTAVLHERGLERGAVLDCACGLGLQAITFKEAGLDVEGADRSPFAVEHARELARAEGHDIPFFVSLWHELPARTPRRYDALFCDALPWIPARRELLAALRGLRETLRPGGVLVFLGPPVGMSGADYRWALRAWFRARPRAALHWRHREGDVACAALTLGELGPDFIDWHLLYVIEEGDAGRLEHVPIRESQRWHWQRLVELCREASFSDLASVAERAWSPGAMPAGMHVATR